MTSPEHVARVVLLLSIIALSPASMNNVSETSWDRACNQGLAKLQATPNAAIITSPGWPNHYPNNELCRWVILASDEHMVIRFRSLDADLYQGAVCFDDYVEVRDGFNSWSPAIRKWCGKRGPSDGEYTSTDSSILVTFKTNKEGTGKGFRLQYYAIIKGSTKYKEVTITGWNIFLYVLFAVIVLGLLFALLWIYAVRLSRERKLTEARDVRDKAAMRRRLALMDDPRKHSLAFVNPAAAADMMMVDDKG